jgi:hydrogenase-4 component B
MSAALFAAALACLGIGSVVDLAWGTRGRVLRVAPYVLATAASACLVAVGARAVGGTPVTISIGSLFAVGREALRIDALAGMFLTLLFGLAVAVSLCFISWAAAEDGRAHRRGVATGYLALLASVAVIICAADAFVFLFAWEALTVSFFLLSSAPRQRDEDAAGAWATLGTGKVSGACLLVGFLLLAGAAHSFRIAAWHALGPGALEDTAWVLLVVGFGAKFGLVPLQVWMPAGYPAAPGPARAAMAGIAANVGVYGLWRFLGVLRPPPPALVVAVLLLGGITAFLGIVFAGVQARLSRLVAFSSIENAGIILSAYGIALTGATIHSVTLEAVGLLAASLQMVAHAIAKSALFSSVAFVEAASGTDNMDALRGVGRRLRWSGAAFGAGALALAGLPPTIGFVSEWFVLEALMQQFRLSGLALRLGLAGAGALVALTTGLAAFTFLRVLGLTFLGRPNPPELEEVGPDAGPVGKVGLVLLGASCLGVAAASPWEVRFLARGLAPLVPHAGVLAALKSPWVLQPVFPGFSILSPSWLWIAMPAAWLGVTGLALLLSRGGFLRVRRVPAWRSATSGVDGPSSYSSFGFANPVRHVLANVLGTERTSVVAGGVVESEELTPSAPGGPAGEDAPLVTRTRVVEPVEAYLYRPIWAGVRFLADAARRLQSGSLNAYMAYMLVALLVALAVAAALG